MLAKLTSKNQLTLPKRAVEAVGRPSHFTIAVEDGRIMLAPARPDAAAAVRRKLAELGIDESDLVAAVAWARSKPDTD